MICGIYRIFNKETKKSYIGSSTNIEHRWEQHISALRLSRHKNAHLQSSYNKHGIESFSFSILEEIAKDALLEHEKYWMNFYKTCDREFGYNISKDPTRPGYEKGRVPNWIRDIHGRKETVGFVSPDGTIYKDIKNVTRFSQEHELCPTQMNMIASDRQGIYKGWTKLNGVIQKMGK
jgi:group I intron endonuclease